MSLLNLFQPKTQIARAAATASHAATATGPKPTASNHAGSAANIEARDAVKTILKSFSEEITQDAQKIDSITQQLMQTQHALLNTAPHNAPIALSKAQEEIKGILGQLHSLHGEFKSTSIQLQQMTK